MTLFADYREASGWAPYRQGVDGVWDSMGFEEDRQFYAMCSSIEGFQKIRSMLGFLRLECFDAESPSIAIVRICPTGTNSSTGNYGAIPALLVWFWSKVEVVPQGA
ncbi:hypothetical protein [Pseudomonas nitroreducens]|uniref:hypothetical protein n=1 Tax=Pseudomonas nitroreducens TaxID=46680 RepID=UPI001FB61A8F|nr:hypothetical protein [Pseudomonas nitroreducens]MCJ1895481.1 hypothetical protein [Pseudomonas nitroreducens]